MSDLARYHEKTEWEKKNPILRSGEPGFEEDTGKLKIGDGTTRWLALPYQDVAPYTLPRAEVSFGGTPSPPLTAEALEALLPSRLSETSLRVLNSGTDPLADTKRLRLISGQKQEPQNAWNGGETIWFDLVNPLAKNMLTWRLRLNRSTRQPLPFTATPDDADFERIVWAGAHYYAQDQVDDQNPTDIHGHWSVEVPDLNLQLRTRFAIDFVDKTSAQRLVGVAIAQVYTQAADFNVNTVNGGSLRIIGPITTERWMEWKTLPNDFMLTKPSALRWRVGTGITTEPGADAGSDWQINHYSDAGVLLGTAMYIKRAKGRVTFGSATQENGRVTSVVGAETAHGFFVKSSGLTTGFAAYAAQTGAANDRLFDVRVGTDTVSRFTVDTTGKMDWGSGAATRDTNLYRKAADVLATDDDFEVVTVGKGVMLHSPDGTRYRITVANGGVLSAVAA